MSIEARSPNVRTGRRLFCVRQVLLILLFAFVDWIGWVNRGDVRVLYVYFGAWLCMGVVLDSWPIVCTLFGVLCACVSQPNVWSGFREGESFRAYFFWVMIGVIAGYLIDAAKTQPSRKSAAKAA